MDGFGSYAKVVKVFTPKHKVAKVIRGPIFLCRVNVATNED
jgi:hypothetical protein